MSSFFQRHVTPIATPEPAENPPVESTPVESTQELSQAQLFEVEK
ncbi:MAG TPA: hypothetical protein VFU89_00925 [Rhabdochlamydiaceae bacterium]|nr:hypothetical protein [Rhabdochlamydiaceae bacterium]